MVTPNTKPNSLPNSSDIWSALWSCCSANNTQPSPWSCRWSSYCLHLASVKLVCRICAGPIFHHLRLPKQLLCNQQRDRSCWDWWPQFPISEQIGWTHCRSVDHGGLQEQTSLCWRILPFPIHHTSCVHSIVWCSSVITLCDLRTRTNILCQRRLHLSLQPILLHGQLHTLLEQLQSISRSYHLYLPHRVHSTRHFLYQRWQMPTWCYLEPLQQFLLLCYTGADLFWFWMYLWILFCS